MQPTWSGKGFILGEVARFLGLADGKRENAYQMIEQQQGWNTKAVEVLKAAASGEDMAGNYAQVSASDTFLEFMRPLSLLDSIPFLKVPLNTPCRVTTMAATGAAGAEKQPRIVSAMKLEAFGMKPSIIDAVSVFTKEFLQHPGANSVVAREMRAGLVAGGDSWALGELIDFVGSNAIPSAGDVGLDVKALLDVVALRGNENLYLVVTPEIANTLSTTMDTLDAPKYPEMSPRGGVLCGVSVCVSSAVPAETVLLVDASQIAFASEPIQIAASQAATIDFRTTGLTENPEFVSMFQTDCVAIRPSRNMAIQPLSENSVAVLVDVIWNESSSN